MANFFKRSVEKLINFVGLIQARKSKTPEEDLQTALRDSQAVAAAWRDSLLAGVLRAADPRALAGRQLSRRLPAALDRVDVARLVDAWKPTPRAHVSYVLATYNRLALLKLAVQCIRNQELSVPSEIVVVDGGSTDGTIDWLVKQADIVSIVQHNRVAEEDYRRRKSWGYFINLGFRVAQGKWICMISDDSLLLPGSVENGLRHAEKLESDGRQVGGVAFYFRDWPKVERYFVQHTLGGMLMVNHGLFLKEALIDVGYAEEDLYSFYKADSDLSLKLWDSGYEIAAGPGAFIEHLMLPAEELRLQNNQTLERDRELMVARWSGRFHDSRAPELFTQPHREFVDSHDERETARLFEPFVANNDGGRQ